MINLQQELLNYPSINLDSLVQDYSEIPDYIKTSVSLYNSALESLSMNSEDIAIIELKKAISINPDFYEAMNLLGICYSYINEYSKATEIFNKVITAENNSVKALRYLNLMNDDDEEEIAGYQGKRAKKHTGGGGFLRKALLPVKKHNKLDFVKYSAGFVIGALLVFLLFISGFISNNVNVERDFKEKEKLLNETISSYQSDYNKLNSEYEKLVTDLQTANEDINYYSSKIKLYEIDNMILRKKYEEAADMLLLMQTITFKEEDKKMFDSMHLEAMTLAAEEVYYKGRDLFKTGEYQQALKKLEKIETYTNNYNKMDGVIYYMAKCYHELNDAAKAKELYQKVIDEYPQSSLVKHAKDRLNILSR